MKRLTEAMKWEDNWFSLLTPTNKLVWLYLVDRCDKAGVWEPNFRLADFHIGQKVNWDEARQSLDKTVRVLKNGKWWLPGFIAFQYGNLHVEQPAGVQIGVIKQLKAHGLEAEYLALVEQAKLNVGRDAREETGALMLNWESSEPTLADAPKKTPVPRKNPFTPPTLAEVAAYAKERNSAVSPKAFWEYFSNGNPPWTDSNGKAVASWKQKFITWENAGLGRSGNAPTTAFPLPKLAN